MEKPDMSTCSEKQWEKWYWETFNEICLKCESKCKQSSIVTLVCPKYKSNQKEVLNVQ